MKSISIGSSNIPLEINKVFILNDNLNNDAKIYATESYVDYGLGFFKTKKLITGELKITNLDTTNFIISGTFWFDAIDANGAIVKVTDGRFDIKLATLNH